jgi:hypothetical protein
MLSQACALRYVRNVPHVRFRQRRDAPTLVPPKKPAAEETTLLAFPNSHQRAQLLLSQLAELLGADWRLKS